jgi:hypothetical protein
LSLAAALVALLLQVEEVRVACFKVLTQYQTDKRS